MPWRDRKEKREEEAESIRDNVLSISTVASKSSPLAMDNWLEEISVDIPEGFTGDERAEDRVDGKRRCGRGLESKAGYFGMYYFYPLSVPSVSRITRARGRARVYVPAAASALLLRDVKEQGNSRVIAP